MDMKPKPTKKRMGRPPLPSGVAKTKMVTIRLTGDEYRMLKDAAKRAGLPMSNLLWRTWLHPELGRARKRGAT